MRIELECAKIIAIVVLLR